MTTDPVTRIQAASGQKTTQFVYHREHGVEARLTLRAGAFNFSLDGGRTVLTADSLGRPWTIWSNEALYRRSYSGTLLKVWRTADNERQREAVTGAEFNALWSGLREMLIADRPRFAAQSGALKQIDQVIALDPAALSDDAVRYRTLYGELGILPPDAYQSIVLQLVEGCPYNRCTFCTFYRHRRYRVRPVAEFESHAREVSLYYGDAVATRNGIFLADADALAADDQALLNALRVCKQHFPGQDVSAFSSSFTRRNRSGDCYKLLVEAGLKRVTLGIESGCNAVLNLLGKPTTAQRSISVVERIKSAGMMVNLMVLVGAGGDRLRESHFERTIEQFRSMPLDRGDRIYLSELHLDAESDYLKRLAALGGKHPTAVEMELESDRFRRAIRESLGVPLQVARYDIREYLP